MAAFAIDPRLQGQVLDEQGHLRANVVVFIDCKRCLNLVYRRGLAVADAGRSSFMGTTTGGLSNNGDVGDSRQSGPRTCRR